jgi:hypothetical protein
MDICVNTYYLNRYLADIAKEDNRQSAIEELTEDLMEKGSEYYPWTLRNMIEALGEMKPTTDKKEKRLWIHNYWAEMAEKEATDRIDNKSDWEPDYDY